MRFPIQTAVLVVLSVATAYANGQDEQRSIVSVECPNAEAGKALLSQWQKLPDGVRKRVELEIISGKRLNEREGKDSQWLKFSAEDRSNR